jgi:hypothetical protein
MRVLRFVLTATVFAILGPMSTMASAAENIVLIYNGPAIPNTQAPPDVQAFQDWCASACAPTVQLPMYDAATGQVKGNIAVWGTPFTFGTGGGSLCFSEFIVFNLAEGSIYTHSPKPYGTCGGVIDPTLMPATHVAAGEVVGGGGDGVIVGGTGKFKKFSGTYTDRVFVEISFGADPNYYDELFFSITGK